MNLVTFASRGCQLGGLGWESRCCFKLKTEPSLSTIPSDCASELLNLDPTIKSIRGLEFIPEPALHP
jgi:hypothetical protein